MKIRILVVAAFALFSPGIRAQSIVSVTHSFIVDPAPSVGSEQNTGKGAGIGKTAVNTLSADVVTRQMAVTDFTAVEKQNAVILSWKAPHTMPSEGYAVEKSVNGIDFFTITQQKSKDNTKGDNSYAYTDRLTGHPPVLYYRIRILEQNENSRLSQTLTVKLNSGTAGDVIVYPNPVRSLLYLNISSNATGQATVTAWNASGAQVLSQQFNLAKGSNVFTVTGFEELQPGIYQVHVKLPGDKVFTRPVLKQ